MEQNENTLSVLKIAPGQYPQQVEIDPEDMEKETVHVHALPLF